MLPRPARMRTGEDLARTRRAGARAGTRTMVVHLAVEPAGTSPVPSPQAGIVVGRAVGPAVVRNRVKRRLRHLIADRWDSLPMGTRLVVRALPPAAGTPARDLGRDLDRALGRLRERAGEGTRTEVSTR